MRTLRGLLFSRRRLDAFALFLALLLPGCGNDVSLPTEATGNIAGAWLGTITSILEEDSCQEMATAYFVQDGEAISGTLTDFPDCGSANQYRFEGRLEGNKLIGEIVLPGLTLPASGGLKRGHLAIKAFRVSWYLDR